MEHSSPKLQLLGVLLDSFRLILATFTVRPGFVHQPQVRLQLETSQLAHSGSVVYGCVLLCNCVAHCFHSPPAQDILIYLLYTLSRSDLSSGVPST